MKNNLLKLLTLTIICAAAVSCGSDKEECAYQPDVSELNIDFTIDRLEDDLLGVSSKAELRQFLQENPVITEYFLKRSQYPDDSIMMDALYKRFTNAHIDTLRQEVDRVFGDLTTLKSELAQAFTHLRYYYPEAKLPKIQTIVTGLDHDLFVSDTLIVIGLDYYLGDGAKYRPLGLYSYMLERYRPQYITPSIMLLYGISGKYNKTNISDKTILADMIGYGKSFYFAKHMMPCTPDSVFIWYSTEEIEGSRANENVIWAHFLENELLYETNHMIKKKYIDERPKTYEIGEKAPGRIATWVGWQIVRQYMDKNEEVTLPQLMEEGQPRKIFDGSRYRPEKK